LVSVLGASDAHIAHRHRRALDEVALDQRGFKAGDERGAFGLRVKARDGLGVNWIGYHLRCRFNR
jgi:hypothetical protein